MALNMVPAVILGDDGGTATAMVSAHNRYTGNWRGSFEGWMISMDAWDLRMKKTLFGLSDFYMVGQWVEPGCGLPPAAFLLQPPQGETWRRCCASGMGRGL